ncbi:hypothetical protein L207DRAFT_571759 [Hyaloscypha variabilis F]|uniref:Uncharacterized protein n=1 Tax=Hyaloscypha variabilis (strain UAMH 11265 / GT02V1 / F) TaxID=1149755 RepID=A0A2J6R393_HYAVF|nr:hypothetical protein L207DRAFT_571759 [Hyaloscypha variabilis F]
MIVEDFAKMAWATTQEIIGKDKFKESNPTSSLMALQLNEPIYMLDIAVSPELVEWVHEFEDDPTQFQFQIPRFPTERYKPPHLPVPPSREIDVRQTIQQSWSRPPNVPPPHLHFQTEDVHITDQPKFTLKVYPIDSTNDNFIPTNRPVPMDLVISITLDEKYGNWGYNIKEFQVKVFCGDLKYQPPKDNPSYVRPPLDAESEPLQPTILTNLRFNVLKSWDGAYLLFRVVPRGKAVPFKITKEASFIIPMVKVLEWPTKEATWVDLKCLVADSEHKDMDPITGGRKILIDKETVPSPPKSVALQFDVWEHVDD